MPHCHPETRTVHGRAAVLMAPCISVQTCDSTSSHAFSDHNLQRMLHHQVQAIRFELFTRKPSHIRVGLVSKQSKSALIAERDLLPHLITPAGVLPCSLDSLAPLDISHQRLLACLAAP